MENENITQNNAEVTQNEVNAGTQPANKNEIKNEDMKTYSKEDLDRNAADTRRATERETKKKLLAQLGLSLDDEDKLNAFKEAYQNSLSDEEKRQTELSNLQAEKVKLINELEQKDYVIKALVALTGKNENDVEKIVKMAKSDIFNAKEIVSFAKKAGEKDIIETYNTIGKKIGAYKNGEADFNRVSEYVLNDIKSSRIKNITFDRL